MVWQVLIPAAVSALSSYLSSRNNKGSDEKVKQAGTLTKEQLRMLQDLEKNPINDTPLYQAGSNYLQNLLGGGEQAFKQFEAPLLNQFNQTIAPGIAERFAGMGAGRSSGLNQALSQAGSNLTAELGAKRAELTQNALGQALQYAQQPYANKLAAIGQNATQPYIKEGQPGQPNGWQTFATNAASTLANYYAGGGSGNANMTAYQAGQNAGLLK